MEVFMNQEQLHFTDQNGIDIFPSANFAEHMQAHEDVTPDLIQDVLSRSSVTEAFPEENGNLVFTREMSEEGISALVYEPVPLRSQMLFAFRKGRPVPSHVTWKGGISTHLMRVVIRPPEQSGNGYELVTAFWCARVQPGVEPISPSINPYTKEGRHMRENAIHQWTMYALSLECTKIDGDPFLSTWEDVIADYGDWYHRYPS
ncbi:MAG: hypothetical protein ABEI13_03310 [Candidatus Paceibacteria bacterium]